MQGRRPKPFTQAEVDKGSGGSENVTCDDVRLGRYRVGVAAKPIGRFRIARHGRFRIDPVNDRKAGVDSDPNRP
jgi:hypothetical protein